MRNKILMIVLTTLLALHISGNALAVKPEDRVTIVDVALAINAESGEFSTLIAALTGTGLVDVLDGNGRFTVFAPTDDGFFTTLGLDAAAMTTLTSTDMGRKLVTEILLYHVARGQRFSDDVLDASRIRMLGSGFTFPNSDNLTIEDNTGDEANLVLIDIPTDNGVIHVIDAVLKPQ